MKTVHFKPHLISINRNRSNFNGVCVGTLTIFAVRLRSRVFLHSFHNQVIAGPRARQIAMNCVTDRFKILEGDAGGLKLQHALMA
jgi:hypothetical protein